MSIVAQSLTHCGKIAELFVRNDATLLLRIAQFCYALRALNTINTLSQRLCYLGIVNLGASVMLCQCSWRSGQL